MVRSTCLKFIFSGEALPMIGRYKWQDIAHDNGYDIITPKPRLSVAKYLMASAIGNSDGIQINPVGCPVALSAWTQPVKTSSITLPIAERAKRLIDFNVFIPSLKLPLFYCFCKIYNSSRDLICDFEVRIG